MEAVLGFLPVATYWYFEAAPISNFAGRWGSSAQTSLLTFCRPLERSHLPTTVAWPWPWPWHNTPAGLCPFNHFYLPQIFKKFEYSIITTLETIINRIKSVFYFILGLQVKALNLHLFLFRPLVRTLHIHCFSPHPPVLVVVTVCSSDIWAAPRLLVLFYLNLLPRTAGQLWPGTVQLFCQRNQIQPDWSQHFCKLGFDWWILFP